MAAFPDNELISQAVTQHKEQVRLVIRASRACEMISRHHCFCLREGVKRVASIRRRSGGISTEYGYKNYRGNTMKFEIPKTMKGIEMLGHGGAEMLGYREDIAVPQMNLMKCWSKWMAAGVSHNTDIGRIGWYQKAMTQTMQVGVGWSLKFPSYPRCWRGFIVAVGTKSCWPYWWACVLNEPCLTEVYGRSATAMVFRFWGDGGFAEYTSSEARLCGEQHHVADVELHLSHVLTQRQRSNSRECGWRWSRAYSWCIGRCGLGGDSIGESARCLRDCDY